MALPNEPLTRGEQYLNRIATGEGTIPDEPLTRMEQYLDYIAENGGSGGGGGGSVTVDSALSGTSTNPVQNKVVKEALDAKADASDIPSVPVQSVNGKTGAVSLNAEDVGAFSETDGAVLESRIDTAISGVTTDSEVIDIRVGADGHTYTTAGTAVRSQFENLNSAFDVQKSANLTNPAFVYGAVINNDTGVITKSNNYYCCSEKIPVSAGETLYLYYNYNGVAGLRKSVNDKIAFYAADDSFISIGYNADSYTVPENAAYCVQQGSKAMMNDGKVGVFKTQLKSGSDQWIPYSEKRVLYEENEPEEIRALGVLTVSEGENLVEPLTFSQAGANNVITNRFPVKPNTTYTLTYDGAANNGISCNVWRYINGVKLQDETQFSFKQGYVTFTTEADVDSACLYFYKAGGLAVADIPMTNVCMVYSNTPAIKYIPYKEKLSANSIPELPDRVYVHSFSPLQSTGHMGCSYYFPQNSIWSWLGAKKAGFDYIECDLQVTADNVIVLIHDPDMRRYGGSSSQTVESLTLAQLQEFDAGAWFDERYAGTKFPVFDDFVGLAKALGMRLTLDCKTINTAERIDAVATILEKWGMQDSVIWESGLFSAVWARVPNAHIKWPSSDTLVSGQYASTPGGWFAAFTGNWPADKKVQKTITIPVNGVDTEIVAWVPADGVRFTVSQNYTVADTYGIEDLQLTGKYAKAFGIGYSLYALDDDDLIAQYVAAIPELTNISSNRTTVQAAMSRKYGIGVSDRPQDLGV